ncbi:MAG: hypothetical protein KKD29_00055 [Candidatus Omnitrophica bacterium]|nr:hypothetical protein [Candidatus Omnitrophota bacterium]MBU4488952.1 hypothetical protein [Candidatus Omnitrophota bacterium]MCG2705247.1 hypothetical protein [Candidatus Omnitrophota bacterium]
MNRLTFVNRAFGIALAISVLWHIVAISAVNIVALPGGYKMRELTAISFLGPILEKTALDIMMANKPVAVRTDYEVNNKIAPEIRTWMKEVPVQDKAAMDMAKKSEEKIGESLGISFRETKEVPAFTRHPKKSKRAARQKEGEISGDVASREVFYKPEKPRVPEPISGAAPFNMELKFSVSPQGDVQEIIPLVSSGNADADLLGIRYLKNWKFTPLGTSTQNEQWGVARIVLSRE